MEFTSGSNPGFEDDECAATSARMLEGDDAMRLVEVGWLVVGITISALFGASVRIVVC